MTGSVTWIKDDRLYTLREAARILKVHPETLRRMCKRREIGHVPGRGRTSPIRIKRSQLQEYLTRVKTVEAI